MEIFPNAIPTAKKADRRNIVLQEEDAERVLKRRGFLISGIQVSSFRPMMQNAEQMRETFQKIRNMGCDTVQLQWMDSTISPEEIAEILKETGLRAVSTQDFYENVKEKKEYFIRVNQMSGGTWVCVSGIPEKYMTSEGLWIFVREMTELQKELESFGLKLCFHPRAGEFTKAGGKDPVEFLVEHMPEEFMLCLDFYHISRAGLALEKVVRKYRGKICMVHFKDYREGETGEILMPAGQGEIAWGETVKECLKAEVVYGFVEQEQWEKDAFVCLEEAFHWLKEATDDAERAEKESDNIASEL